MIALLQVAVLYTLLFLFFSRFGAKRFLMILGVVSIPLRTTVDFFSTHVVAWTNSVSLSISDLCFLAVAMSGIRWSRAERHPSFSRLLSGFILVSAVSAINSRWLSMTAFQVINLIQLTFLYFFVVRCALVEQKDLQAFAIGMSVSLLLQGAIGCLQYGTGHNFLLFSTGPGQGGTEMVGDEQTADFMRVVGTLGKPNVYGSHVALLFIFSLITRRLKLVPPLLQWLALIFGTIGLILSESRGAWLSTAIALVGYGVIMMKWRILSFRRATVGFALAIVILLPFLPMIQTRLIADDHNAAMSRIPLMSVAANMIRAHPLIGIGANTYTGEIYRYVPRDYPQEYLFEVHNLYLVVAAECGLLGLLVLLLLLLSVLRCSYSLALRGSDAIISVVGAATFAMTLQILLYANVDMYNSVTDMRTLLITFAIVHFCLKRERETSSLQGAIEGSEWSLPVATV